MESLKKNKNVQVIRRQNKLFITYFLLWNEFKKKNHKFFDHLKHDNSLATPPCTIVILEKKRIIFIFVILKIPDGVVSCIKICVLKKKKIWMTALSIFTNENRNELYFNSRKWKTWRLHSHAYINCILTVCTRK